MANQRGYVRRSRLVVSKAIERPLTKEEVVHHIDGNTLNDSLENLWLFENLGKHKSFEERQCKLLIEELVKLKYISKEEIYKILRTILKEFCIK